MLSYKFFRLYPIMVCQFYLKSLFLFVAQRFIVCFAQKNTRPRSDVTHAKQSVCLCSIASGTCADMCCYVLLLVLLNVLFLDLQIFQYV